MSSVPVFRPFDPDGPLRVYVRHLPHWRQPGATYFITFRQGDSIPQPVLAEWLDIKTRWFRARGLDPNWLHTQPKRFASGYQRIPAGVRRAFEREQARMLHEELDRCHGSCVLRDVAARRVVTESLVFFHGRRLWLGDSVVMPNHVHAIVQPWDGWELEDLLGAIKKWTSRVIGVALAEWARASRVALETVGSEAVGSETQPTRVRLWQAESYDRIIRDLEELFAFRRYIIGNPEVAHLRPGEFLYTPAEWLDSYARL